MLCALVLGAPDGARAQNPLFKGPFRGQGSSDPSVGFFDGQLRVTSSRGRRVRNSADFFNWREDKPLFKRGGAPPWAVGGRVGSSKISQLRDGSYVLLFGALHRGSKENRRFCIGRAVARTPFAFKNQGLLSYGGRKGRKGGRKGRSGKERGPLFCAGKQSRPDYSLIDPDLFRDPATDSLYVLYKRQLQLRRGRPGGLADIVIRPVGQDARSPLGPITRLVQASGKGSDNKSVEAPTMVKRGNRYFLFYSIANYRTDSYAVSVAASRQGMANTPTGGDFIKFAGNPIYSGRRDKDFCGVGHQDIVFSPNNKWRIFAHAYLDERRTKKGRPRCVTKRCVSKRRARGRARCVMTNRELVSDELRWNIPTANRKFSWPSVGDGTPSGNGTPAGTLR